MKALTGPKTSSKLGLLK